MTLGGIVAVAGVGLVIAAAGAVSGAVLVLKGMLACYNEGIKAFCEGVERRDCPYTSGYNGQFWERGWDYAWYKVRANRPDIDLGKRTKPPADADENRGDVPTDPPTEGAST